MIYHNFPPKSPIERKKKMPVVKENKLNRQALNSALSLMYRSGFVAFHKIEEDWCNDGKTITTRIEILRKRF